MYGKDVQMSLEVTDKMLERKRISSAVRLPKYKRAWKVWGLEWVELQKEWK